MERLAIGVEFDIKPGMVADSLAAARLQGERTWRD
jgi:hypothetical protein